jgi:hypothetical protein
MAGFEVITEDQLPEESREAIERRDKKSGKAIP